MKRLLRGEKTDLGIDLKGISTVVLCVLLFNTASPQVPIDGFCRLTSIPAFPGYNKLFTSDVNYDSYQDIILYSASQRSIAIIEGKIDSTFTDYQLINTPYYFSDVAAVFNRDTGSEQYFFTSRKKRIAGLFDFSNFDRFNLIANIDFDSFPEKTCVADVNNDGYPEYLVSGSGFNGLSVIEYREDKLVESKIDVNSSYGDAVFIDISNDGYPDIVAFNLFNNSLAVFYNDGDGNFEIVRSITPGSNIENMQKVYFNNDDYEDLAFSTNGSINILTGDFQSSYDSLISINTEYHPHRFIISDFNKDRLKDIAYIDTARGSLSIIFGKTDNQFYSEVVYMQKEGIVDLQSYRSGNFNGLVILNTRGEIYIVSRLSSLPDETKIIPALQPSTITSFDLGNDGISDLCYIDSFTNSLIFLVNDSFGVPSFFYSTSVSEDHKRIVVDDTEPYNKGFYLYSPGKKILEIIDLDFQNVIAKSDQLYSPGVIKDLEIKRKDELVHIYLLYEKDNILKLGEYEHRGFRYNFREYPFEETEVLSAELLISEYPEVFYWKAIGDSLHFIDAKISSRSTDYFKIGKINRKKDPLIKNFAEHLLSKENPLILTLFGAENNLFAIVSNDSMFNISNPVNETFSLVGNKMNTLYSDYDQGNNFQNVLMYLPEKNNFFRIETKDNGRKLSITKLFDAEKVTDFIIQKTVYNKNFLIYTQKSEGFLSLKRLK